MAKATKQENKTKELNKSKETPKLITRRFTIGFRPTPEQSAFFDATANCARIVYNDYLSLVKADLENRRKWCENHGFKNLTEWAKSKGYDEYNDWKKEKLAELAREADRAGVSLPAVRTLDTPDGDYYLTLTGNDISKLVTTFAKRIHGEETDEDFKTKQKINYPEFEKIKVIDEENDKEYTRLSFTGKVSNPNRAFLKTYTLPEPVNGLETVSIPNVPLQQSYRDADQALNKFFKEPKVRFPKWKKKNENVGIRFTNAIVLPVEGKDRTFKVNLNNLPGKSLIIKIKKNDPFPYKMPSTVTIKKEPTGKYSISFVFFYEKPEIAPATGKIAGADMGFKDSATVYYRDANSDIPDEFETFDNHRFFRKNAKDLKRKQRQLARMEPGSKNYEKKRMELARYHSKIKNNRKRYNDKIAKTITDKADLVSLETLNIAGMARRSKENRHRRGGRNVSDTGMRYIMDKIEQKADEQGKRTVYIPHNYASTQLCSVCGTKCGPKGIKNLGVRNWTCSHCGARHQRDQNASINILNKGLEMEESQLAPKKPKTKK